MSFAHKSCLLDDAKAGFSCKTEQTQNFFHTLFYSKADFRSANLTSEVIFFQRDSKGSHLYERLWVNKVAVAFHS